ncbi:MAG TPA: hypothetical protein VGT41_02710 [Candidatus Babeliales bacterium]|nr:hypothetical protein [Candidatus Babeliales bacterium]
MIIKKLRIFILLLVATTINAVNVVIHNKIPLKMYVRWEFVGDYFRREIAAATKKTIAGPDGNPLEVITEGIKGVNDWRLHKGFTDVHIIGAKVGEVWGKDPETGAPLVFTAKMLDKNGGCWGIAPQIYSAPAGQAVYNNFGLNLVPKRNPKDNNNWWPSFVIWRMDESVEGKIKKAFEKAGKTIYKEVLKPTAKALEKAGKAVADRFKDTKLTRAIDYATRKAGLEIAHKTATGVLIASQAAATGTLIAARETAKGALVVAEQFLDKVVENTTYGVMKGSAETAKGILEGTKQVTTGIIKAGKFIVVEPLDLFDLNEIKYHGRLQDIGRGVLGDVKVVAELFHQPVNFSITLDVKAGFNAVTKALKSVIDKVANELVNALIKPFENIVSKSHKTIQPALPIATIVMTLPPISSANVDLILDTADKELNEAEQESIIAEQQTIAFASDIEQELASIPALLRVNHQDLAAVRALVENSTSKDVNAADALGTTVLMLMIIKNNYRTVSDDPNSSYQAYLKNPNLPNQLCAVLSLLVAKGAVWNAKDLKGRTALDFATFNGMTDPAKDPFLPLLTDGKSTCPTQ